MKTFTTHADNRIADMTEKELHLEEARLKALLQRGDMNVKQAERLRHVRSALKAISNAHRGL